MPIIETRRRGLFGLGRETRKVIEANAPNAWQSAWSNGDGGRTGGSLGDIAALLRFLFLGRPEERVDWSVETQHTIQRLQARSMANWTFVILVAWELAAWGWALAGLYPIAFIGLLLLMWAIVLTARALASERQPPEPKRLLVDSVYIILAVAMLVTFDHLLSVSVPWYIAIPTILVTDVAIAVAVGGGFLNWRFGHELRNPRGDVGPMGLVQQAVAQMIYSMIPQPPPQPVIYRLEITNDNGLQRQIVYEDLPPGVDFGLLATFVQGARTRGTAREAWINPGGGKPRLTREQYEAVKELLFRHGWAREVTPGVPQHGWVISQRADVLLERLRDWRDTGHPPTPEPLAVVGTEDVANQPTASQRPGVKPIDYGESEDKED